MIEAEHRGDDWFACDRPTSLGQHLIRDTAKNVADFVNRRTQDGSQPAVADPGLRRGRPGALGDLRRAETLLRGGGSDEEVERLTGVDLADILSLRATFATCAGPAPQRDRFSGRRWWK